MIQLFLAIIFLSASTIANKSILLFMPVMLFSALKLSIPAIVYTGYCLAKGKSDFIEKAWQNTKIIFFIIFCTTITPTFLKMFALKNLPTAKATLIGSLEPFVAAFYSYFLWKEKINLKQFFAMILVVIGSLFLFASKTSPELMFKSFWIFSLPEIAGLCAIVAGKLGWALVKNFMKKEIFTPLEITTITMLGSGFFSSVIAGFTVDSATNIFNIQTALMVLSAACVNSTGYILFTSSLQRHSLKTVSMAGCLIPAFVAIGSYFAFGERVTLSTLVSGVIIFIAIKIFFDAKKGPGQKPIS